MNIGRISVEFSMNLPDLKEFACQAIKPEGKCRNCVAV